MTVVDAWLMFKACVSESNETQKEFYELLAEEMIDNELDNVVTRNRHTRRRPNTPVDANNVALSSGTGVHLTPTKEKRKNRDGIVRDKHLKQGRCSICDKKSSFICSECKADGDIKWLCHSKTGRNCFHQHCCDNHA